MLALADALGDNEADGDKLALSLADEESEADSLALGDNDAEGDKEADALADGESETLSDADGDSDAEGDKLALADALGTSLVRSNNNKVILESSYHADCTFRKVICAFCCQRYTGNGSSIIPM